MTDTPGKKILRFFRDQKGGLTAFAKKTGKERTYFYYNLKSDPLERDFVDFLTKHGIDVKRITGKAQVDVINIPVILSDGRQANVQLPKDYSSKDLEKVARVIQAYKE